MENVETQTEGGPTSGGSAPGILGVGIGLLVLAALGLALAQPFLSRGSGDGDAELLSDLFPSPRPLGLRLTTGAALASGERLLRLAPADEGNAGDASAIDEVILAIYGSPASIEDLFEIEWGEEKRTAGRIAGWNADPDSEFHAETQRGEVVWSDWRAPYRVVRLFEEGGSWREATTVNLTTRERALAVHVLWASETPASEETLREILDGVAFADGDA